MSGIYDRADIYDRIETEERFNICKRHWERILHGREIRLSCFPACPDRDMESCGWYCVLAKKERQG